MVIAIGLSWRADLGVRSPRAGCSNFTSCVISKGRNFEAKPSTKCFSQTRLPNARGGQRHHRISKDNELNYRARITLDLPDKLLVLTTLLERRKTDLLIQLHGLRHLPDIQRVGSQFV